MLQIRHKDPNKQRPHVRKQGCVQHGNKHVSTHIPFLYIEYINNEKFKCI